MVSGSHPRFCLPLPALSLRIIRASRLHSYAALFNSVQFRGGRTVLHPAVTGPAEFSSASTLVDRYLARLGTIPHRRDPRIELAGKSPPHAHSPTPPAVRVCYTCCNCNFHLHLHPISGVYRCVRRPQRTVKLSWADVEIQASPRPAPAVMVLEHFLRVIKSHCIYFVMNIQMPL